MHKKRCEVLCLFVCLTTVAAGRVPWKGGRRVNWFVGLAGG